MRLNWLVSVLACALSSRGIIQRSGGADIVCGRRVCVCLCVRAKTPELLIRNWCNLVGIRVMVAPSRSGYISVTFDLDRKLHITWKLRLKFQWNFKVVAYLSWLVRSNRSGHVQSLHLTLRATFIKFEFYCVKFTKTLTPARSKICESLCNYVSGELKTTGKSSGDERPERDIGLRYSLR